MPKRWTKRTGTRPLFAILLLACTVLVLADESSPPKTATMSDETLECTILDQRPADGEVCIVCKQQVYGKDIVEIRCKGRSFHVASGMMGVFEADPRRYFVNLEARSGLFDERAIGGFFGLGWLLAGVYVFVGLLFAAICGYLALARGHLPLPWFFAGLVGNVAGLAVLLATPRRQPLPLSATRVPALCPRCGEPNHPAAPACGGCSATLVPTAEPETALC
jgi:hypothetical protein